jgi:hypothetical protein
MGKGTRIERAVIAAFDSASAASPRELSNLGAEACSALRSMQRAIARFVIAVDKKRHPAVYALLSRAARRGAQIHHG